MAAKKGESATTNAKKQNDDLMQLSRAEIQALAKAHDIKANLKSSSIIAQLLGKFPDGVPSLKTGAQPLPPKKGGANQKKTRAVKQEEDVDVLSHGFSGPSVLERIPTPPHQPLAAADEHTIAPTEAAGRRTRNVAKSPTLHPPPSTASQSIQESAPRESSQDAEENQASNADPNVEDYDDLSEISDYSHNPSPSSRGASPQPPANNATVQYVVDIIVANMEEDKKLLVQVLRLRERASMAKRLLHEQHQRLQAEREHRERILSYLTYQVRNNNRWMGDIVNPEELGELYQVWKTNAGRGWKDMGEWEFNEIWSGPITLAPNGVELAASNTDDFIRNALKDQEQEGADSGAEGTLQPPSPDVDVPRDPASPIAQKRKATVLESGEEPISPEKRAKYSHHAGGLDSSAHRHLSPLPNSHRDKGKGKMSAKEVERLEHEQVNERRVRGLGELDEGDSAEGYQMQIALENSILESAESTEGHFTERHL